MAVAVEEAAKTNLCTLDLVSFRHGSRKLVDRGLVLWDSNADADVNVAEALTILRVDGSLVTKNSSDIFGIFDRTYLWVGSFVESVSDYGGQIGVIARVATKLSVVQLNDCLGGTKVEKRVSPADLRRVRALSLGDYVVSGQWLGRVVQVSLDIEISFDDGAVCRVAEAECKKLPRGDTTQALLPDTNTAFYPGARVLTRDSSAIFMEARWLTGEWNPDHDEGKVTKVVMTDVLVYWIASAEHNMESAPPANQNPDNLTFFFSAPECTWRFGDRCFLSTDIENHKNEQGSSAPPPTMAVSYTRASMEVLWQDGTRQNMANSMFVSPVEFLNDLDFFPGQYVVDKSPTDDTMVDDTSGPKRRIGLVRSLNSKEHMVKVSWLKAAETGPDSCEVECDETVSAYELARDPDRFVFYGDVVVRLLSDAGESTTLSHQQPQVKSAPADLSWVGHVVDLPDGHVQVKWGDGTTSKVLPHEISVANNEHYKELRAEMGDWLEDDGVDAPEESGVLNADNDLHDPTDATNVEDDRVQGSDGSADELAGPVATMENVEVSAHVSAGSHEDPIVDGDATETRNDAIIHDDSGDDSAEDVVIKVDANRDDDPPKFPNFDVVKSPRDHHYLDSMEQGSGSGKRWVKAVQKEWKILLNGLPDSIYVRAFEDRMDLIRAVMVGASGTPYQDGLFFYDLQLPPSYPAEPPQVYYHSFGLRTNPNLYESGTVCLSLLNTFDGEDTEVWSPTTSSLLQVLVSIQGLVLNDQPYYNESAYETLVGTLAGHRNALPYRENACLLNLRTMLYLLRRPPQGFKEFVKDHFRHKGRFVLKTCQQWLQGCAMDTLAGDARAIEAGNERPCSVGLKVALAKLVPSLLAAFMEIGAEGCDDIQFKELKSR